MKKDVYIFIGQSGAGKGTQAKLLKNKIENSIEKKDILYLEVGNHFRSLIKEDTFTSKKVKLLTSEGKLPPPFLGIHMWAHDLIYNYSENKTVIIDGTPRVPDEVPVLISACIFYDWHPYVFNIQVSDDWSYQRIKARGRADDKNEKDVWGRIQWYHESVEPSINILQQSSEISFHNIEGEKDIESVHRDICEILNLD